MNFKKTFAGLAAASVAAASLSAVAGAQLTSDGAKQDANGMDLVYAGAGSFMPIAYNNGERNETVLADKNKAIVDYGIDWTQAKSVEVQWHVVEGYEDSWLEDWDGSHNNMGGAVIVSSNAAGNASHNWNAKEFYGVTDEDLKFTSDEGDEISFTLETAKELQSEKVAPYTYKVVCPIDDTNSVVPDAQLVQISFSDYASQSDWQCAVEYMSVKDASGNALITWTGAAPRSDYNGSAIPADTAVPVAAATAVVEETPAAEEAPAAEDTTPAATETASTETAAPAAGDVQAATASSKGSPNTGIEDVAGIAGLAVVAAGAVIVAKKRK